MDQYRTHLMPAFYINLDEDMDRRALLEAELSRAGIQAERVAAVLGRAVPDWLQSFYDERLAPGEVGCSASHLVICTNIIERQLPYALVLEDDARLASDMKAVIQRAVELAPQGWDIIRLIETSKDRVQVLAAVGEGRNLVRYLRIPRSTTGMIVSASGARKLLSRRLIKEPIDVEIRWPWQLGLDVYGIDPPVVEQASEKSLPTTIPHRSMPRKYNQLRRMIFNIRKMGLSEYLACRFGLGRRANTRIFPAAGGNFSRFRNFVAPMSLMLI